MRMHAVVDHECLEDSEEEARQKICTCDLTEPTCDVNCCCDADCSEDDRQAFSHCADIRM